ncbi:unnamed protein product [Amoebophrya sp. A25]|nr:unnamed protein product [Amoebophrya sp. A25]|eukprot:GSA25T00006334001.1
MCRRQAQQLWIESLAQTDRHTGRNVLQMAIESVGVHVHLIELLLKACALDATVLHDVLRHQDFDGETCVKKAVRLGRKDVLEALRRHFKI